MVETAVLIYVCACVHKNVRQGGSEGKSPSICEWCEAGSVFSSVLWYFGIILLDDTLAQAHGQDHTEKLEETVDNLVIC